MEDKRDWKECDLCNKEVFTKKDADGFISICPECREQDEKRLEQLAEIRTELKFKNDVIGDRDKQLKEVQDRYEADAEGYTELLNENKEQSKRIKELEERKSWKAQCDECKRLGKLGTLERENADLKADKRKVLISELYGLYENQIKWECQCPPERRGAEIALLHLLGFSWEAANKISFNATWKDIEKALKRADEHGDGRKVLRENCARNQEPPCEL